MRILFLADAVSIHTRRWAESFRDQGHEIHVASFRTASIDGVNVHILKNHGLGKFGYFFAVPQLRRLASMIRPDIFHAQYVTSYGFLSALAGLKPLVVTALGTDVLISPRESVLLRIFAGYALKKANFVTTVAEHMNQAVQRLGAPVHKTIAIPFGVDTDLFCFPSKPRPLIPPLRIISTRNFSPVYSVHTVIHAVHILLGRDVAVSLDLVGDGPSRPELEKLVHELGMEHNVRFHGHIDHGRLIFLLGQAHIFVSTAVSDGNNISLNEAMSCGCIPIATKIPANSQWIIHGENGFLFTSGDSDSLSASILRAADSSNWGAIAMRNRQLVEERADWSVCICQMRDIYLDLMNRKSAS